MTRAEFNPYAAPAETTAQDYDPPSEHDVQVLATPVQRFVGNFVDTLVIVFPAVFAYIPIVRLDGSNPGFLYGVFMRSFVARLAGFIPGVGNLYNLVDALFVFRADRRTIHDHIAGTRVIQL